MTGRSGCGKKLLKLLICRFGQLRSARMIMPMRFKYEYAHMVSACMAYMGMPGAIIFGCGKCVVMKVGLTAILLSFHPLTCMPHGPVQLTAQKATLEVCEQVGERMREL